MDVDTNMEKTLPSRSMKGGRARREMTQSTLEDRQGIQTTSVGEGRNSALEGPGKWKERDFGKHFNGQGHSS